MAKWWIQVTVKTTCEFVDHNRQKIHKAFKSRGGYKIKEYQLFFLGIKILTNIVKPKLFIFSRIN